MFVTSKYKYKAQRQDELSFKKKERLELLEEREAWYVCQKESGETGLAPSNYFHPVEMLVNGGGSPAPPPLPQEDSDEEDDFPCPICGTLVSMAAAASHTCSNANKAKSREEELETQLAALVEAVESSSRNSQRQDSTLAAQFAEERRLHAKAVQRATELSELYEAAVARAQNIEDELKALKKKTARMAQLFTAQKKELEQGKAPALIDSAELNNLRRENAALKEELQQLRAAPQSAKPASGAPPPPPPPGPPPPPAPIAMVSPRRGGGMMDAINKGVQLKKTPKVDPTQKKSISHGQNAGQPNLGMMAAMIARQRKNKAVEAQVQFARNSLRRK